MKKHVCICRQAKVRNHTHVLCVCEGFMRCRHLFSPPKLSTLVRDCLAALWYSAARPGDKDLFRVERYEVSSDDSVFGDIDEGVMAGFGKTGGINETKGDDSADFTISVSENDSHKT